MQYLIRQFKDSTGHIHTDIEKARTNETLSIVGGSKEQALKVYKAQRQKEALMSVIKGYKNLRSDCLMIKRILKIWFIIGMYELSKYLTNELIVKLQSEDDIDTAPKDFASESDQTDLNGVKR